MTLQSCGDTRSNHEQTALQLWGADDEVYEEISCSCWPNIPRDDNFLRIGFSRPPREAALAPPRPFNNYAASKDKKLFVYSNACREAQPRRECDHTLSRIQSSISVSSSTTGMASSMVFSAAVDAGVAVCSAC